MIEQLAVVPGEGMVIRYGHVTAWVGDLASPSLLTFLAESARNLASSPIGGDQLADHLAGVLQRRDPEPDVPFVVVGPSEDGWVALLHGPVHVWDGQDWTAPGRHRGWVRVALAPQPVLAAGPAGSAAPGSGDGSRFDLEGGVVPGGGFRLIPSVSVAREENLARAATVAMSAGQETVEPFLADPEEPETAEEIPEGLDVPDIEPEDAEPATGPDVTALLEAAEAVAAEVPPAAPELPTDPAPPGALDLRRPEIHARVAPQPPLPRAGEADGPVTGVPVIAGVSCTRHHLNRPGMSKCARCRQPVAESDHQITGSRPALGCLITDLGSVYRLDSGYLVGSDPAKDPTVRGRLARPLALAGADLAVAHAEIRLQDWDVVLTDRASAGGTFVYAPDGGKWERLPPYEPRVLEPGTHIAFGQSVVTFVSPWHEGEA